jgi:hypothetical protein
MHSEKENDLLAALARAQDLRNAEAIANAGNALALYYAVVANEFDKAVPYWANGAADLEKVRPNSRELGTYLQNMAELCLIPAKRNDEARSVLLKAKAIYSNHFKLGSKPLQDIDALLGSLQ